MVHENVSMCWCPWCNLFCNQFLQLNTKLFSIKISDRKVGITFVATVLLGKLSKDVFTALKPWVWDACTQISYVKGYEK